MARPKKCTVDYFPHDCHHGKTMLIIETRYGNDGYAFWFKLLELLGGSEGHFIDLNDPPTLEFLTSVTRTTEDLAVGILNLLAKLAAIDPELWENGIIWSSNFMARIADAYRNRTEGTPGRPDYLCKKREVAGVSDVRNPQTKLKETKVKETKTTLCDLSSHDPVEKLNGRDLECEFKTFYEAYPRKRNPAHALKAYVKQGKAGILPAIEDLLTALEDQKTWPEWTKDKGEFIPHPASWLNGERWKDERTGPPARPRRNYEDRANHEVINTD